MTQVRAYLPIGPFAGQMDADTGDDSGLVLETHDSQVQAVSGHEVARLSQVFCGCIITALVL